MSKVCFLDNDIILKLASCGLFDVAIASLNLTQSDLRVLYTAEKVFAKSRRTKRQYPEKIRKNAIKIVSKLQTIKQIQNTELILLENEKNLSIDPGEVTLVAATLQETSFWLTTGDKKFLIALANLQKLDSIHQRLTGNVVCLEQLIRQLIYQEGFTFVLTRILPIRQYDTALKAVFGSGEKSVEKNVLLALEEYIEDLRTKTKGLLADL